MGHADDAGAGFRVQRALADAGLLGHFGHSHPLEFDHVLDDDGERGEGAGSCRVEHLPVHALLQHAASGANAGRHGVGAFHKHVVIGHGPPAAQASLAFLDARCYILSQEPGKRKRVGTVANKTLWQGPQVEGQLVLPQLKQNQYQTHQGIPQAEYDGIIQRCSRVAGKGNLRGSKYVPDALRQQTSRELAEDYQSLKHGLKASSIN